jgi:hypothetical protein
MSGLTPELALGTAVGSDDTANYLVSTLASALNVIDGEFSSATGHNHNGAHQGGALVFGVLSTTSIAFANGATLGPFSTGTTLRFQSINVTHSGNISADGNATITGTLGVTGATTLSALTVTGSVMGALNLSGVLNANAGIGTTSITTTARITAGTDIVVGNGNLFLGSTGDTTLIRGGAGLVNIQSAALSGNLSVTGASTFNGVTTHNQTVNIAAAYKLQWPGGASINQGDLSGSSANTVYMGTHGAVFFDFTVGHTITCQNLVQTSDMRLKSGAAVMTDDVCIARIRDPGVSVYSYQLAPPEGGSTPPDGVTPTPTDIGFDAAQIYAASPEFAALRDGTPVGVNYSNMAALLWGALRQLDARVQALEP